MVIVLIIKNELKIVPSFSHGIFQTILFPIPVWSTFIGKSPRS